MNTCDCVNPPGGTASCDDDQLAICVVENGVAHAFCITMPTDSAAASQAYRDAARYLARIAPRRQAEVLEALGPDAARVFGPASSALAIANFVLAIVKVEPREPDQDISANDARVFFAGEHRSRDRVTRFSVPPPWGHAVDRLTRPRRGVPVEATEQELMEEGPGVTA